MTTSLRLWYVGFSINLYLKLSKLNLKLKLFITIGVYDRHYTMAKLKSCIAVYKLLITIQKVFKCTFLKIQFWHSNIQFSTYTNSESIVQVLIEFDSYNRFLLVLLDFLHLFPHFYITSIFSETLVVTLYKLLYSYVKEMCRLWV